MRDRHTCSLFPGFPGSMQGSASAQGFLGAWLQPRACSWQGAQWDLSWGIPKLTIHFSIPQVTIVQ